MIVSILGVGCGWREQAMLLYEYASSIVFHRVGTFQCETNIMMVVGFASATLDWPTIPAGLSDATHA